VNATDSLVANTPLLTKTACPRLLMPLSAIASALFDLVIALGMMFVVLALYGQPVSWRLVFLPGVILLGVTLATGIGIILTSVNIRHRDVRNGLPFAMQLLLFLSPIAYSLGSFGGSVITLNPLVGIVEAFRWSVIGTPAPTMLALFMAVAVAVVLLAGALVYFARVARDFADVA
jgi:lipopolysaccharide transport system permease protein